MVLRSGLRNFRRAKSPVRKTNHRLTQALMKNKKAANRKKTDSKSSATRRRLQAAAGKLRDKNLRKLSSQVSIDTIIWQTMSELRSHMLSASNETNKEDYEDFFEKVKDKDWLMFAVSSGIAESWSQIPQAAQNRFLKLAKLSAVDKVVEVINSEVAEGADFLVSLTTAHLTCKAMQTLYQWWNGEITGKRCFKNIIDATVTCAAATGGSTAGAALGSFFGVINPFAKMLCSITGGVLGMTAGHAACSRLTQYLFDVPKEVALEEAFKFLKVHKSASNNTINDAFLKLCFEFKRTKSNEDFYNLQLCMGIIKVSRGEKYC